MKKILITGSNSFIGTSVEKWLLKDVNYQIDTIDTMNDAWKNADFSKYDVVFHVAGIAHVNPKPEMAPIYYNVNCELTLDIARHAKKLGVKQFIFMSSMIVYHASKSLKGTIIDQFTKPNPNDFYGDSKMKAENGLHELEADSFKIAILRPCMIYGNGGKGNFQRLAHLALKTPIFPAWHNRRSMLYIDNLCEFVKQTINLQLSGTFHLQNKEYADTVEIVKHYASKKQHKILCSRLFNPLVWCTSFFFTSVCKMFSDQYYTQDLTTYNFEYQLVSFKESLDKINF